MVGAETGGFLVEATGRLEAREGLDTVRRGKKEILQKGGGKK